MEEKTVVPGSANGAPKPGTPEYHRQWRANNPERRKEHLRGWRARNPEYARDYARLRTYGVTPEQYVEKLEEQGGVCAICKQPCVTGRLLAVDHDHAAAVFVFRGLLCLNCNQGLGKFMDSPELLRAAAEYLERSRAVQQNGSHPR